MLICDNCFIDEELQIAIANESSGIDVCDACGQVAPVVDADIFGDFFNNLLGLFHPQTNGTDVVSLLQNDWNVFTNKVIGKTIINYFLTKGSFGYDISTKVGYESSIINAITIWEKIKNEVREDKRFFADLSFFDGKNMIIANNTVPKDTLLYRARIIPPKRKYLRKNEMGCPPQGNASAGRANPLGIPYLYLSKEEVTTYYEVKSLYLDRLAVGVFKTNRDLNILDFTAKLSLYYAYSNSTDPLADIISKQKILQLISSDLSKPLRRYDSEIEYVPTQLICEYIKINGVDGIGFNSSLHIGGVNYVLFDSKSANCIKVQSKEIRTVKISK